jgi:hypothetical protein
MFVWIVCFSETEFLENNANELRSEQWNFIVRTEGFILWFSATEFVENTADELRS